MIIPALSQADLSGLSVAFPDLNFDDQQRRDVLLEPGSRDVQAAPGSGKTTLLAAKLQLMSEKWPHTNRGICVLSHTNVAGREIATRLEATPTGARLLGYPHFLGTIHAFVNQYLALPFLRSEGNPIDIIDNDVFAVRAISRLKAKRKLWGWVSHNENQGLQAIASLRYEGSNLSLGWEKGNLPSAGTASRTEAKQLKDSLAALGVFRHDDMFAYAECLLVRFPDFSTRISHRFPLVLIDEMQDTSWAQEELLSRLFDASVVVQRFGDRNQRILSSAEDASKLTFPRDGHLSVTTTKRFPESIAAVVRTVQEHGESLVAAEEPGSLPPTLMLYESKEVISVIEGFGKYVLDIFSDEELKTGAVKAICARKQGTASVAPGRHIGDYWPAYNTSSVSSAGEECIFRLLVQPPGAFTQALSLKQRARDVTRSVLLALRAAGCPLVSGVRSPEVLLRGLASAGIACDEVRSLVRKLTVELDQTLTPLKWIDAIDLMFAVLSPLIPPSMNREQFGALDVFEVPVEPDSGGTCMNEVIAKKGDRSLNVRIGTIAGVKGETHLATLVMESYAGRARCFDLQEAIENIATSKPLKANTSETMLGIYRNLYVATSRPSRLLCLAMNLDHIKEEHILMLGSKGWVVAVLESSTKHFAAVDVTGA